MASKAELKAQFCDITGVRMEIATKILEKFRWDFNGAIESYFRSKHKLDNPMDPNHAKALADLFDRYKDPDNHEIISIEGTLAYLNDLGIDPEDTRSLTLAFILKSPQTGEFPRKSFIDFWTAHRTFRIPDMRELLEFNHDLNKESPKRFEEFYAYCFDFVRGSDMRIKSISTDDAVMYWQLIFGDREELIPSAERLSQWYEFIGSSERSITKDTWVMFYKFLKEIINEDPVSLSKYDEMSSWPSLVDEYVEWLEENGRLTRAGK